jgi:ubiquitin C-terminal hydrolase
MRIDDLLLLVSIQLTCREIKVIFKLFDDRMQMCDCFFFFELFFKRLHIDLDFLGSFGKFQG